MLIDSIVLENYQCYFGQKTFKFTNGLNIVLGNNGEGKTAFIEAFEWLFFDSSVDLSKIVSRKKESETELGKSFEVSVTLSTMIENDIIYSFIRSFVVEKKLTNEIHIGKSQLNATSKNIKTGNLQKISGSEMLELLFPTSVRKYSIFKGEEALNIFEQKDTLKDLIEQFSSAKTYSAYQDYGKYFVKSISDELEKTIIRNSKNKKQTEVIFGNIKYFESNISLLSPKLTEKKVRLKGVIKDLEKIQNISRNREQLEQINDDIKNIEEAIRKIRINDDYTNYLFDDSWILFHFGPIIDEYTNKVAKFSEEKRDLEQAYIFEKGRNDGLVASFNKEYKQLPIETPSKSIMQEMLHDQICKVCNREALEGSDAYNFMYNKLQALIESTMPKVKVDEKPLFPNKYVRELELLNEKYTDSLKDINSLKILISDNFDHNLTLKSKVENYEKQLIELQEKKIALIGNSGGDEKKLTKTINDFIGWTEEKYKLIDQIEKDEFAIEELEKNIESERDKLVELNNASGNSNSKLDSIKSIFEDILLIFKETKNKKFIEFISSVENVANEKFLLINKNSYTGKINIKVSYIGDRPEAEILLLDGEDRDFKANKSLETSMNISILLAINEIVKKTRYHSYPILMDAPVSSFDEDKKKELMESLYNLEDHQTIVFLKDYVKENIIDESFKHIKRNNALWIKVKRPFDRQQLNTLDTIIENIR
jgi:DNA sulfur modification protein DndD